MSELEQKYGQFVGRHPEIRSANIKGMLNIRGVARAFIEEEDIAAKHIEAVVAMIRRYDFKPIIGYTDKKIFSDIKISIKDDITLLDYAKSKNIVEKIKSVVSNIDYDKNDTLKVVVGSHSVKIIIDSSNSSAVKDVTGKTGLIKEYRPISEISLIFPQKALEVKGIISYVTSELLINGINIREIVTCTPELIIYVDENQSLKTYEILKNIKSGTN
jgi:hypothetical protein